MGNLCTGSATKGECQMKRGTRGGRDVSYFPPENVKVLAINLDYTGYDALDVSGVKPLTCSYDVNRFLALCKTFGVPEGNMVRMSDTRKNVDTWQWPNAENVLSALTWCAEEWVEEGDLFIFFYAGHGSQGEDSQFFGDEADGKDETLVLMQPDGSRDDLYDDALVAPLAAFDDSVPILCLTDCCHSGSICDLDSGSFGKQQIVHLAAVMDTQEATGFKGGNKKGGLFTCALLETLEEMIRNEEQCPSVAEVFNRTTASYGAKATAQENQTFQFQYTNSCDPNTFAWPLYPEKYAVDTGGAMDEYLVEASPAFADESDE